ncbi:hypothetical protein K504DRAFT_375661 [Pleomassaria siparia CBS 279.74]|uniref:Protein transport protein sec16 n=1 Tax=Pleomassaria siparia CBS 279.74 TaxID=1314801 RepID=A0A6G1KF84_9PLEO|nr:hypothetical protein K504DRAFT_375661 [Pleomassaria siparia CBS 279.74]
MDMDDGPDSSRARGGASDKPTSSWNPALRPDNDQSSTAQSAIKSSDARIEAPKESAPEDGEDEDEDEDENEEKEKSPAAVAPASHAIFDKEPSAEEDFFDRFSQSVPQPPTTETNGHGLNGVDDEALVSATQGLSLDDQLPESANGDSNGTYGYAEHKRQMAEEAPEEHPAENYEHQGEATLLEEAVNESVKVPLVADSEAMSDDWGASGEVFDLGGKPQDALLETPLETPLPEAASTTVGDQVIGNTTIGGNAGEEMDWGNADDQDFFGVVTSSQHAEAEGSATRSVGDAGAAGSESIWDLSLDDDFLPDNDDAPAPFDLDDDEGFLEDEPSQPVQAPQTGASKYAPQVVQAPQPATTTYGLQGPQFTDFSQIEQKKPMATPNVAYGGYNQALPYQQQQQQTARPAMSTSAQSFADKAKGGYSSPYDLPEDVVTTRRRPAARTTVTAPSLHPTYPPPRISSAYANAAAGAPRLPPPPPSNMSTSNMSPPSSSHSMQSSMTGLPPNVPPKPVAPAKNSSSDFFAELPISSRPKPPPSGRYSSQQNQQGTQQHHPGYHAPPPFSPKDRTPSMSSLRNEVLPDSGSLLSQLQQPDRLPAFPDQPTAPVRSNSLPVPHAAVPPVPNRYSPIPPVPATSRYSPAPPPTTSNPPTKYSPAPPQVSQVSQGAPNNKYISEPSAGMSRPPSQPYAPRTSSPLAFRESPQEQHEALASTPEQNVQYHIGHHAMHSAESIPRLPFKSPLQGVSEMEEQATTQAYEQPTSPRSGTPPLRSNPSSTVGSPRRRTNYTPQYQPAHPSAQSNASPPRAQSQSPTATMKQPLRERPASGHDYMSLTQTFKAQAIPQNGINVIPHRRQASHDFNFITPSDERAADPLERWKGYPIFKWGLGGTTITSFPKQIPRYGGGASMPMMKCSPGEVKIQSIKEIIPLSEDITKFPGPLKGKGKKKDVLAWLGREIELLDAQLNAPGLERSMDADSLTRLQEKTLLWKIMQVLVDNDGLLEGNATAEVAVRRVLSPESEESSAKPEESFTTAADLVGIPKPSTVAQAEPIDPRAIEHLRNLLTTGDREKAVWHAVDQRLWAHAMLLSSTLSKDVWKQVVQEFIRKEVKKVGRNSQALAVLYEVFAGNHEDCIDELVPASARAGFQMVSTDGAGPTQNALQGLDKWRETLSLILSNRSEGDVAAILSLGRLLSGYGRVEAAHVCFIFARSVALIGGVDDAQSDIVLVGADHRAHPLDMGNELEPVLLSEVYEFALSLSAPGGLHVLPHLQNYKLAHAYALAEYGHRADAQAYCDAIAAAMKATTRVSPYYNGSFIASLDDLSKRLSHSPKDGSSWISKPSMDKVSTSLFNKFTTFVTGDDDDATSNHSAGAEVGPFAKIAGSTPQLSPSHSSADLYAAYSGFSSSAPPGPPVNSKYAPSNIYAPRTSLDQGRPSFQSQGRPSLESDNGSVGMRATSDSHLASPQFSGPYTPLQSQFSSSIQQTQAPKNQSYSAYQSPPPVPNATPAYGGYQPLSASADEQPVQRSASYGGYEPPSYEAPSNSYEPPTNSYEPPAYEPYNPDDDDEKSPVDKPKKKKQFFDDDDDDNNTDARTDKKASKSEADRKAEEAFRKAAEADAQKDNKDNKDGKKAGWFGGWFKKDPNAAPGPIKAKLGEENSFYYDPDLKKWVNKKAGESEQTKPMATPPPPKSGPLSRSVSGNVAAANHAMGLPNSLPHSSMSAPPLRLPPGNPQRSTSMPPPMNNSISRASTPGLPSDNEGSKAPVLLPPQFASGGPPSRPGTGMSTASSIEDLIGAAGSQKSGTVRKKKKTGRYIDVMAKP